MQIGETYRLSHFLTEGKLNDKKVYVLDSQNSTLEEDMVLVKFDKENNKWAPVHEIKDGIPKDKLTEEYGLWKDKEIKGGFLFKHVERPLDGKAEPDEVIPFKEILDQEYVTGEGRNVSSYGSRMKIADAEINLYNGPKGTLALLETTHKITGCYSSRRIVTEGDLPPI